MKVIMLAAGVGKRMSAVTNIIPKCLIKIGEKTLLPESCRRTQEDEHGDKHIAGRVGEIEPKVALAQNPDRLPVGLVHATPPEVESDEPGEISDSGRPQLVIS